MKKYFLRKYIFASCFFAVILLYAGTSFLQGRYTLRWYLNQLMAKDWTSNFAALPKELDTIVGEILIGEDAFLESYSEIQYVLQKDEYRDFAYIKDANGYLYSGSFYKEDDPQLLEYAKRIGRLQESVSLKGTKVIFVSPPEKDTTTLVDLKYRGAIHRTDYIQDEFLLYLQYNQIDTIDLRKCLRLSEYSYNELFYKADNHWTTQAAFVAFKEIVDRLESDYGENIDPDGYYRDIENYIVKKYPQCMLGNIGHETGKAYAGMDDFTLIYPKFDVSLSWEAVKEDGNEISKKGDFRKALLLEENIVQEDIYDGVSYSTYLNRINAWDKIVNEDNADGIKVLCIRDAYFSPVAAFMAPLCSEIHMISPFVDSNKVDVEEYLKENEFDYIFIECYPTKIYEKAFLYFKE